MTATLFGWANRLAHESATHAASICIPRAQPGESTDQSVLRWKHGLHEAETGLLARGVRPAVVREWLHHARELLDAPVLRRETGGGVAHFAGPELQETVTTTEPLEEIAAVGSRYLVTPLLAASQACGVFHLLALSRKRARLYRVTSVALEPIELPGVPQGVGDIFLPEDRSEQVQQHSVGGVAAGRPVIYHGQGSTERSAPEHLRHYLRRVDAGVRAALGAHDDLPLMLAADVSVRPSYHEVNQHPLLLEHAVDGNVDAWDDASLFERARGVFDERVRGPLDARTSDATAALQEGRGVVDFMRVLPAAFSGRVATLLFDATTHRWGTCDDAGDHASLQGTPAPGLEDLTNAAAIATLRQGGATLAVDKRQLPGSSAVAATLRY